MSEIYIKGVPIFVKTIIQPFFAKVAISSSLNDGWQGSW
jgi:hypothetical protein